MGGPPVERVSGILVGMVREMTEVNRDLAHQVAELRAEHKQHAEVVRLVKVHLDDNAKAALLRANSSSWLYKTGAAIAKLPGVPLASVALALWLARLLGVIEFLPNGGAP